MGSIRKEVENASDWIPVDFHVNSSPFQGDHHHVCLPDVLAERNPPHSEDPMTSRRDVPFARSLHSTGAPKLTNEQLAKRRSEVIRYYNELSRKTAAGTPGTTRPTTSPPPPPHPSTSSTSSKKASFRKSNPKTNGQMPVVAENVEAETWEQIKQLTEQLFDARPVTSISREDVEHHVGMVWKLVVAAAAGEEGR